MGVSKSSPLHTYLRCLVIVTWLRNTVPAPHIATRPRANRVREYDIQDLLVRAKRGVAKVYARATRSVLEEAVNNLAEPVGEVIKFE